MSPGPDITDITAVLLADGWHEVLDYSFHIDAYSFWAVTDDDADDDDAEPSLMYDGGAGFWFLTDDGGPAILSGPMSSVLAVQNR